jgi:hypothetical protein
LLELLVVIAIIAVVVMFALPMISGVDDAARDTKDKANASHVANMSEALAAMGVAHVFPESLGGTEATIRLLREGVVVTGGPFSGQTFMIRPLNNREVAGAARYLELIYDNHEIRLAYTGSLGGSPES